jgi:Zn-dependent protease with chaperone function
VVRLALSRSREWLADAGSVELTIAAARNAPRVNDIGMINLNRGLMN